MADVMSAAPCHFPVLTWAYNTSALVQRGKPKGHKAWVGVELDTEESGPSATSVSLEHGPGWMDPCPDCLWGSDWPGEILEHFWIWPGHVMSPMASHIFPSLTLSHSSIGCSSVVQ